MQDVDNAFPELVIGDSLGQHLCPINLDKLPATSHLSLAPVPAELLVDGTVVYVDEEAEAVLRQLQEVDSH